MKCRSPSSPSILPASVVQQDQPISMFDRADDKSEDLAERREHLRKMAALTRYHVDFHINGKRGYGKQGDMTYTGLETTPGVYLFHIKTPDGSFYNNQFFTDPNERHIIGPFVKAPGNELTQVLSQTFRRISYNVPEDLKERHRDGPA